MRITVIGLGYVGLANAAMLARDHEVIGYDIDSERVGTVNSGHAPFADRDLDYWLTGEPLMLQATAEASVAYREPDMVLVAVPTSYDETTGTFDTSIVEAVISDAARLAPGVPVVIRSTVPVGFTRELQRIHPDTHIAFVPEFLREGQALADTLTPSRVLVGVESPERVGEVTIGGLLSAPSGCGYHVMSFEEAESVKLFSNTYLAMRVAFFNELDTYAQVNGLNSEKIINAVSADDRIGRGYNNPSFGYGGYCLPKDTKQLRANFSTVPETMISAIVESNYVRKAYIANTIFHIASRWSIDPTVGIYRLTVKTGSDNWRDSAVLDVIDPLIRRGVRVIVHEPELTEAFGGCEVVDDLDEFTARSTLIVANRYSDDLAHVKEKVFTRDIFRRD